MKYRYVEEKKTGNHGRKENLPSLDHQGRKKEAMQSVRDYGLVQRLNELLPGSRPQLLYKQTIILGELIDQLVELIDLKLTRSDRNLCFTFAQLPTNYKEALQKANLHDVDVSSSSIKEALESQVEDIIRNSDTVLKLIDGELRDFIISLHYDDRVGFLIYYEEDFREELKDDISRLLRRTTYIIFNNKVTWESLVPYLSLRKNVLMYSPHLASELYEKLETKAMVIVSESVKIQDEINAIVCQKILSIFKYINDDRPSWVVVDRPLSSIVSNVNGVVSNVTRMVSNYVTGPFTTVNNEVPFTTVENEVWDNCSGRAIYNEEYVFTVVYHYRYRAEPGLNIMRVKFQQYDFGVVVSERYFPTSFDPISEVNRCFYLASGIGMRVHPLEIIRQMRALARSALANDNYLEYLRQQSNIVVDRSGNTDGSIIEMFEEIRSRGNFFDMDALRYLWPECFRNKMLCVFSFHNIRENGQHKFKACPFYQHPDDNISQENIIFLHHDGAHFTLLQPKEITKEVIYDRRSQAERERSVETDNFFKSMKDIFDEHNKTLGMMRLSNIPCYDSPIPYQPDQMSRQLIYNPAVNYEQFLRK